MPTRKTGFTLIELLVVIVIMMLLMSLLLPAVLRARLIVQRIQVQGQITAIAKACDSYHQFFNAYPGVINDPPASNGTPSKISGAQTLRLSLMGCSRDGSSYDVRYNGPAENIDRYGVSTVRKYDPFYTPKPQELVRHSSAYGLNSARNAGYSGDIEVFVDYHLTPARPILYFRALPRYVNSSLFEYDDNEVYCDTGKGESSEALSSLLSSPAKSQSGFVLVSSGMDRIFFANAANSSSSDDLVNFNK